MPKITDVEAASILQEWLREQKKGGSPWVLYALEPSILAAIAALTRTEGNNKVNDGNEWQR